jgi:hypothetical protein
MAFLSRDSCVRVPKSRQPGLSRLWGRKTSFVDLWLRCGLKQSCSPRRELSNDMWHVACSQVNRVDSWLLVVGSHFLSNWQFWLPAFLLPITCAADVQMACEAILDIYTSRPFQWYKKLLMAKRFDPCNRALKIRESFRDSNSQHGSSLGSVSLSHTFLHSREYVMWLPGFLLARTLATPLPWSQAQS